MLGKAGVGVLPGAVRREQPPCLNNSPAAPGLAEEKAHAPEGRKQKVKERRAGATMGAPRGCPGAQCARPLRGRRRRTKAATAAGRLWGRAGCRGSSEFCPRGFVAVLGFEVVRISAHRGCLAARLGASPPLAGARHFKSDLNLFFFFFFFCFYRSGLVWVCLTGTSHLRVSLTPLPLASPLALAQ